jgi:hypothetical protein
MDFTRDEDNTLRISPTKYNDKRIKNNEKLFGMKPNTSVTSPLKKEIIQNLTHLNYAPWIR